MHHLLEIWFGWVLSGGYIGIIVLMAMGSMPLPVPAEAVLPPAAFLAAQGKLNPVGVVLAGTLGAYSEETRRCRTLAQSLRGRRSFFRASFADRASSHFHPGGNRADEFSSVQLGHDSGLGDFV